MAAQAVVARRPWPRLVLGARLLPIVCPESGTPHCYWRMVGGVARRAGVMAAQAVVARRPWPRLVLAKLWVRPRRLHHEGQPEGQPERSDQPIQMENPYKDPPKRCVLCGINVDYKNVQLLSQFVSPYTGSIYGRHITGLCNKKQKEITKAIKRAHVFGFMPVMFKNPQFITDPKLCNIKYPE